MTNDGPISSSRSAATTAFRLACQELGLAVVKDHPVDPSHHLVQSVAVVLDVQVDRVGPTTSPPLGKFVEQGELVGRAGHREEDVAAVAVRPWARGAGASIRTLRSTETYRGPFMLSVVAAVPAEGLGPGAALEAGGVDVEVVEVLDVVLGEVLADGPDEAHVAEEACRRGEVDARPAEDLLRAVAGGSRWCRCRCCR